MSVTRIAEVIQPTAWMRTADSACVQLQEKTPALSNSAKTAIETLLIMLNPIALSAFVLAAWRMGQDLDWTGNFFIENGLFSHWQVWMVIGIALKATHVMLSRVQAAPVESPAASMATRVPERAISRAA